MCKRCLLARRCRDARVIITETVDLMRASRYGHYLSSTSRHVQTTCSARLPAVSSPSLGTSQRRRRHCSVAPRRSYANGRLFICHRSGPFWNNRAPVVTMTSISRSLVSSINVFKARKRAGQRRDSRDVRSHASVNGSGPTRQCKGLADGYTEQWGLHTYETDLSWLSF